MSNQLKPLPRETLNAEFLESLRTAYSASHALVESHLKPFGLSVPQALLFGHLADRLLKGTQPVQKDLEGDMKLVTSSITNLVQGLERKGLIARQDSAQDGRAKELLITEAGWKVRGELGSDADVWKARLTRSLSDQELGDLVRLLGKLTKDE